MDFKFLYETFLSLLGGVPLTLNLAVIAMTCGTVMAFALALMRISPFWFLRIIAFGYVTAYRGTPLLVQIFLIYYGFGQFRPTLQALGMWAVFREPYWCAIIALSLNCGAYASEVLRGGLLSVPRQQVEAARSVGMSRTLLYRRIVLPVAIRQALPAYGSEIIIMIKSTSLASVITLMEVTGTAAKLVSESYRVIEVFAAAGAIYLLINFVLAMAVALLERILSPHQRAQRTLSIAGR